MKLIAACLFCLFALPAASPAMGRGDTSHFIDKLSCDSGPYGLKLPETYDELLAHCFTIAGTREEICS